MRQTIQSTYGKLKPLKKFGIDRKPVFRNRILSGYKSPRIFQSDVFPDHKQNTPKNSNKANQLLLECAASGNLKGVKEALSAGADIEYYEKLSLRVGILPIPIQEATAFLLAAYNGHLPVVEYLFEQKANINARTFYKRHNALLLAAKGNHTQVCKFLISKGCDVNFQHIEGGPLHAAVVNRNVELIVHLLDNGADPLLKLSNSLDSPLEFARTHAPDISHLLE
jgi:ankyrin repeat protein